MDRQQPGLANKDPGSDVTIRRAGIDDEHLLLRLIEQYYAFDGIPFDGRRVSMGLSELLRSETIGNAWIVYAGPVIAGYAIATFGFDLELGGRQATLTDLFLVPDYRRRGIGTAILRHVERECEKAGAGGLELQVESANTRAREFYLAMGYESHERVPMMKRFEPAA